MATPTIRYNSKGRKVADLQRRLLALGFNPGAGGRGFRAQDAIRCEGFPGPGGRAEGQAARGGRDRRAADGVGACSSEGRKAGPGDVLHRNADRRDLYPSDCRAYNVLMKSGEKKNEER